MNSLNAGTGPLLVFFCVSFFSALALGGEDLQWEIVNRVVLGKDSPSITLTSARSLKDARLNVVRNDGDVRELRFGPILAGEKQKVILSVGEGRWEYQGTLRIVPERGELREFPVSFNVIVAPPLQLEVPYDRLEVKKGRLELRLSRPGASCQYVVLKEGQAPLRGTEEFKGTAAQDWLTLDWGTPASEDVVLKIAIECLDVDGFSNGIELFPWQIEVPHEDVNFDTNSYEVLLAEVPKVEAAARQIVRTVRRYGAVLSLKLFVSGHTDSVGKKEANQKLSEKRAAVIGRELIRAGVQIPVYYYGYGEEGQGVVTPDETASLTNRRVRYILAAEAPEKVQWRSLK